MTEPTEGTTTCIVDHEGDESKKEAVVSEEASKTTKKTQGANTLRKKKKRKMKEQQEASAAGPGVEPKADAASPANEEPKSGESDTRAKNEVATQEQTGGNEVSQQGEGLADSPRNKNDDAKKNEDEQPKNENEGEKKSKAGKKKGKKKSKKENGEASKDGAEANEASQQTQQGPGDNLSPRPPPKKADEGEEKKKKKKKKPKTPRGDAGGVIGEGNAPAADEPSLTGSAGLVKPLKLGSSDGTAEVAKPHKKSKKGAQTDRAGERVTNPPLSAVRAGPSAALLASAPSAGIKFASRLSLANVIPKLSTLPFEKKPRVFNSNVYAQPFSGKSLVKWMLEADTGVRFEPEAMILGELMLNASVIVPLSRKVEFSPSSKDFYALTEAYADYARPRGLSLGGSMISRVSSADETKRLTRRSSVMLSFRSISMRGLNHLAGVSKDKDKDKKDEDTKESIQLVYGRSLEEVMGLQLQTHPDEKIPVILKTLTKAVIDTQGHKTEGIFRVPGKNDEISRLKAQFNRKVATGSH